MLNLFYIFKYFVLIITAVFSIQAFSLEDKDKIFIHIKNFPPFFIQEKEGGEIKSGILYDLIKKILQESKINYTFENSPIGRSVDEIKKNKRLVCLSYAVKTKDRENIAYFSEPIFRDYRMVLIYRKRDKRIFDKYKKFSDILQNNNLKILLKIGYSYGEYGDKILNKFKNYDKTSLSLSDPNNKSLVTTSVETEIMLKQIVHERADYMLDGGNQTKYLFENNDEAKKYLEIKNLDDYPLGQLRYFMCSKSMPKEKMYIINQAIKKIVNKLD
jgi:uncharacterized protein (TIGR02285 family)